MNTIKHTLQLIIGTLLLVSCETTIDYDLPTEPSKITIDTKLKTGDSVAVVVGTSIYALSSNNPILMDTTAKVWLYENNVPVSRLTITENPAPRNVRFFFSSDYKLKANQTYKVEASLNGYTTAFGEGISKDSVPISSTQFDSISKNLVLTFQDPPTKGDYYMITISNQSPYYLHNYSTNDVVLDFFDNTSFDDPFGDGSGNEKYGTNGYLSDQYFNGKTKTLKLRIDEIYVGNDPNFDIRYYVQLWRISEDLYEHQRTKAIAWQSDNPFSEPVQIYSNISNGYGIVGTVALSSKQFYP